MSVHEIGELLLRLFLATLAGGILGFERESQNKAAGLRTHMMVCLGSALFVTIGMTLARTEQQLSNGVEFDPLRVLQGLIGGVGFLGAGAIIHSRGAVQGITTAASIWLTAAIGTSCGLGYYLIAFFAVLFGWGVLLLVGRFEHHYLQSTDAHNRE